MKWNARGQKGHRQGSIFHVLSAYSWIVLSLLNLPEPATLRILILVHFSCSTNALSAAACYHTQSRLNSNALKVNSNMYGLETQKNTNEVPEPQGNSQNQNQEDRNHYQLPPCHIRIWSSPYSQNIHLEPS